MKIVKSKINDTVAVGRLYVQYQKEFLARTEGLRAEMQDRYTRLWASGYFHHKPSTHYKASSDVVEGTVVDNETEFAN